MPGPGGSFCFSGGFRLGGGVSGPAVVVVGWVDGEVVDGVVCVVVELELVVGGDVVAPVDVVAVVDVVPPVVVVDVVDVVVVVVVTVVSAQWSSFLPPRALPCATQS